MQNAFNKYASLFAVLLITAGSSRAADQKAPAARRPVPEDAVREMKLATVTL